MNRKLKLISAEQSAELSPELRQKLENFGFEQRELAVEGMNLIDPALTTDYTSEEDRREVLKRAGVFLQQSLIAYANAGNKEEVIVTRKCRVRLYLMRGMNTKASIEVDRISKGEMPKVRSVLILSEQDLNFRHEFQA